MGAISHLPRRADSHHHGNVSLGAIDHSVTSHLCRMDLGHPDLPLAAMAPETLCEKRRSGVIYSGIGSLRFTVLPSQMASSVALS